MIQHQFNKVVHPGESFEGQVSKVVPDQNMSVREILDRFRRGLPVTGARVPIYDEEGDLDITELKKLDLVDQHEIASQAREQIDLAKKDQAKKLKEQERKKWQKEFEASQPKPAPNTTPPAVP